ncbi:MAG: PEP-CTERM sorting domain-containing protein [Verrucomicrobia bacterium]|nr:PEP-CTERM sorting domain-containing protein [Verrucomicrobiota bacterium]
MKKLVLATAILAIGSVVAQAATTFTNSTGDISVASNWDNGLPTLASPGTIGSGVVADRTADVDINEQVIIIGNGGSLISAASSYTTHEFYGMGTTLTVETGGIYMRTNAAARWTGGTLNVYGGNALVNGIVPFDTGADPLVGGWNLNVTGGTFESQKMANHNDSETALPFTVNVSDGSATFGVFNNDTRLIDEENVFFNVSGGSLILNDHSFAAGGNDTNIVITVSNDGTLTTHQFDRGNNATALADRYVNLLGEDGASWTWTGTNEAAFVALWDAGTLRHDGVSGLDTETFSDHFTVSGSTLTVIPEPATIGLVMAFGGGILFIRRKLMI